jgi:hypothetical protein
MDEKSGYVYALINPSQEGLVRIEVTRGDPAQGAKDISIASNAESPYIVIFEQWFQDCKAALAFIQDHLAEHESSEKGGFISASNTEAIRAILEAKSRLEPPNRPEQTAESNTLEDTAKRNRRNFCRQLLTEGQRYQYGDPSTPKDESEAIKVYEKAIDMNCFDANRLIGTLYYERYVFKTASDLDLRKALKYYEDDISNGNSRCWGDAARCYEKLRAYRNAEICWGNFWRHGKDLKKTLDKDSQDHYAARFQEYMTSAARREHRKLTLQVAINVGSTYDELPEGRNEAQYRALFHVDYPG